MSGFFDKFKKSTKSARESFRNGVSAISSDSSEMNHVYYDGETSSTSTGTEMQDLANGVEDSLSMRHRGALAHSLDQLLCDAHALSYFIQYLESCDKLNLIKFWLHVEGFKASAGTATETAGRALHSLSLVDARSLFAKYVDEASPNTLALPRKISSAIREGLRVEDPAHFDPALFDDAQLFVRQLFELRYFIEFQFSVYYKKHELEVLSEECTVLDILHTQALLASFIEFVSPSDRSCVEFLLAAESFESQLEEQTDEEAMGDAMAIYDKYFSMQAPCRLDMAGCEHPLRVDIETRICTESGRPTTDAFHSARRLVTRILTTKYLRSFLSSSPYQQHIADLQQHIDQAVELPRRGGGNRGRSSTSDAASSVSAYESLPPVNKQLEQLAHNSSPAHSWSSPGRSSRMPPVPVGTPETPRSPRTTNLAEIDEMGRYRVLYDDSLSCEANQPSRLKLKLRKYLDKSALREEDIAEEVARTIIADIHNMVSQADQRG